MNIYRASVIWVHTRQSQSWWFLADQEDEVRSMVSNLLGPASVKHLNIIVEKVPARKGMLCSESNNREVWLKAFKPEEWAKIEEELKEEEQEQESWVALGRKALQGLED